MTPEQKAGVSIDRTIAASRLARQRFDRCQYPRHHYRRIHEFSIHASSGIPGYLLYIDGRAAGVIEAKKEGGTLTGVEVPAGGL